MYCNKKIYEIKYTDVDFDRKLRLSSLLSNLEQSSAISAEELGFGYSEITPRGLAFILANYYIEFIRPIKLGETLTVHTWPLAPTKLICLRDFELFCGEEKVGVATSRWCLMDVDKYKLVPTSMLFADKNVVYNENRSVDFSAWRIPSFDDMDYCYDKVVRYSDYDYYNHVNNTKYADFVLDAFTTDFLRGKFLSQVQISYVKQCKEGEILAFFKKCDGDYYFVEGRVDGEVRIQMKLKFGI